MAQQELIPNWAPPTGRMGEATTTGAPPTAPESEARGTTLASRMSPPPDLQFASPSPVRPQAQGGPVLAPDQRPET